MSIQWRNSNMKYGWLAIVFHWLTALAVFGLFGLGLYMVELDYYNPWYTRGPAIHKSIGILLAALFVVRLLWRWSNPVPAPLGGFTLMNRLAHWLHRLFYLLLPLIFLSGYFISTADGRGISVFGWFSVPGYPLGIERQEDIAGQVHYWLAWTLIGLVGLHVAGALKHHWFDRDRTLLRIMKPGNPNDGPGSQ